MRTRKMWKQCTRATALVAAAFGLAAQGRLPAQQAGSSGTGTGGAMSDDALGRGSSPASGAAGADGVLGTADDVPALLDAGPVSPAGADGMLGTADDKRADTDGRAFVVPGRGVLVPGGLWGWFDVRSPGQDTNFGNGGPGGVDSAGGTDASDTRDSGRAAPDGFDALDGVTASGTEFDSLDGVVGTGR